MQLELGALFVELVEQGGGLCEVFGLVGEEGITQPDHVFGAEDVCHQLVEDGLLELFFGDPKGVAFLAIAFLFGGAGVIAVGVVLGAAVDRFACEWCATVPTAQQTCEDVVAGFGAGMVAEGLRVVLIRGEGVFVDHLYFLPGWSIDYWLAVVFDDGISVVHDADVDFVGEEVVPAGFAFV